MTLLLTYEQFVEQLKQIINLSNFLLDGWTFREEKNVEAGIFATKKVRKLWKKKDNSEETITFEYHVAYNVSYCVPVICFIAYKNNGTQLNLEQCWEILDIKNPYSMVTQLDHPVLKVPFLTIHPCKTSEFFDLCFHRSNNLVVSWLTTVGPFVGLDVLQDYAKLTLLMSINNT